MKTSRIVLFYNITQTEIVPPAQIELERKDAWIKEMQKMVESEWKPLIVKVVYEMFDPAIENQRKFFEGAVVPYYAIQNGDYKEEVPDSETLKQYREEILDEALGYDYHTVNKIIRKRDSTADFKTVAKWNKFLTTLDETLFANGGYEFPDSDHFWELTKKHGYDEAKVIAIEQLQARLKKKV